MTLGIWWHLAGLLLFIFSWVSLLLYWYGGRIWQIWLKIGKTFLLGLSGLFLLWLVKGSLRDIDHSSVAWIIVICGVFAAALCLRVLIRTWGGGLIELEGGK